MNIIRIISTIVWYLTFFTGYHYLATWGNPDNGTMNI